MEINDLWLNIKGNYTFLISKKKTFEFILKYLALKKRCISTFLTHPKQPEEIDEFDTISFALKR